MIARFEADTGARRESCDQAAQQIEVLFVVFEVGPLGCFQAHRQSPETFVVHSELEGRQADVVRGSCFWYAAFAVTEAARSWI